MPSSLISRRSLILGGLLSISLAALLPQINNRDEVYVTRLDLGIGGTLAFLPDLHLHEADEVERVMSALSDLRPDVVVIGGDLVDEETQRFDVVDDFLRGLDAREKLAVLGNHEYWSLKDGECIASLRRWGFTVLHGMRYDSKVGQLYGFDWSESRVYNRLKFDGIVIAHDPNSADYVDGAALVLAGHTHGGLMMGDFPVITNSRYTRGLYEFRDGKRLYVSRGLGNMRLQVRINSPPELLIVE
ncbi:MAG: metallophosphoesterase [Aigarchaeota archaeon]|nr:metallophosphoesterase [Aigarchaeota archaeon]MDW8093158.1 metallophosphoesterase [Nitrososphaerota archaeon]